MSFETLERRHLLALDFGDAPDIVAGTGVGNYRTLASDNGPNHFVDLGIYLGVAPPDGEDDGRPNLTANGDDSAGDLPGDEDGLVDPVADLTVNMGSRPHVDVIITNLTGVPATLRGWIDFNGDGVFDNESESATLDAATADETTKERLAWSEGEVVTLVFPEVPSGYVGQTYARFRFSTDDAAVVNPFGAADDGEVEDYVAQVRLPRSASFPSGHRQPLFYGDFVDNEFGQSIAWLGDLDNNGFDDLAVGAPGDDTGGRNRGAVHILFRDGDETPIRTQIIASEMGGLDALSNLDRFGSAISAVGDLDNNGVTDLIVSAPGYGSDRGEVYVLRMNTDGTVGSTNKLVDESELFTQLDANAGFGVALTVVGDIDGDGIDDLAIASKEQASSDVGSVHLMLMNHDFTVKHSQVLDGTMGAIENPSRFWGASVVGLGDVDGDQVPDLAVGDPASGQGVVDLLFMNPNGSVRDSALIDTPYLRASFGKSLAAPGDLDDDQVPDLVVGHLSGASVLLLGPDGEVGLRSQVIGNGVDSVTSLVNADGSTITTLALADEEEISFHPIQVTLYDDPGQDFIRPFRPWQEGFGRSLATFDRLGNGLSTLIIGVPEDDIGGTDRGAIYVMVTEEPLLVASGEEDGAHFGASVAAVGDINGDGVEDLIVGAPGANNGQGALYPLLMNADGTVKEQRDFRSITTGRPFSLEDVAGFGTSISVVGDIDGDGFDDLAVASSDVAGNGPGIHLLFMDPTMWVKSFRLLDENVGGVGDVDFSWGFSVAGVGDVNGDDVPDLAVGAPQAGIDGKGVVDLLFMNSNGTVKDTATIAGRQEQFGTSLLGLGDLDGDGVPEIAVGGLEAQVLFLESNGEVALSHTFSPADEALVTGLASWPDPDDEDRTKLAHAAGGWIKIDTFHRGISVGSPLDDKLLPFRSVDSDDFGHSLVSLGDLDGRGMEDLVMGTPEMNAAHVLFFGSNGIERVTEISNNGGGLGDILNPDDEFGYAVAEIGDLNRDGTLDLAVGAPGTQDDRGAVHILLMNPDGTAKNIKVLASGVNGMRALSPGARFGRVVAPLGDLDEDGVQDIAVGRYVLFMSQDGTVKDSRVIAPDTEGVDTALSGSAVAAVGDVNGDGTTDLVMLGSVDTSQYADPTALYVLLMDQNGTVDHAQKISGRSVSSTGAFLPHLSILPAGDLDADGVPDVSVYLEDGLWQILLNNDGTAKEMTFEFDRSNHGAFSATPVGDWDGDGVADTLVGYVGQYGFRRVGLDDPGRRTLGDVGDAPDTGIGNGAWNYNTRVNDNGPVHTSPGGIYLGSFWSKDVFASPSIFADGDDDDGVENPETALVLTAGASATIELVVNNSSNLPGMLYGWIDTNFDGVFDDATERVSAEIPPYTNHDQVPLVFPSIPSGVDGQTYARFRISTDEAAASATGVAVDGEVEDYVVSIVSAPSIAVRESVRIPPPDHSSKSGGAIAYLGDIDGDEIGDLAVGHYQNNRVSILRMNADGSVKSRSQFSGPYDAFSSFGASIASLGDIDGDGITDIAVGAFGAGDAGGAAVGSVYVVHLDADGNPKNPIVYGSGLGSLLTLERKDGFGSSVTAIGDLNNDGVVDLAVGAPGVHNVYSNLGGGAVFIFFMNPDGTAESWTRLNVGTGIARTSEFGRSAAAAGDLDRDGVPDLAVGAFGSFFFIRMNPDGSVKGMTRVSELDGVDSVAGDYFGFSVAALLPITDEGDDEEPAEDDEDNVTRFVVGAPRDNTGGYLRGAIHILELNPDGTLKSSAKIAEGVGGGPTFPDSTEYPDPAYFGSAIAAMDDLDGDGIREFAVGARESEGGQVDIIYLTRETPDFGDAPESYGSPSHSAKTSLVLGGFVDGEGSANHNSSATGDDIVGGLTSDEDGLVDAERDLVLSAGQAPTIELRATNTTGQNATLYGWIDLDKNGVFDPDERAHHSVDDGWRAVGVTLTFPTVPEGFTGTTYARFRLSTDPAAAEPTGAAEDGEVEDYLITVPNLDFGDAPNQYKTINADDGPSHLVASDIYLGSRVDAEFDAVPNSSATADDIVGPLIDDEDGVVDARRDLTLTSDQVPIVEVNVTNDTDFVAKLFGWIDSDGNGSFDEDEKASFDVEPGTIAQMVPLTFPAVPEGFSGVTYARFRLSTDAAAAAPTGYADDGEVEDYQVTIVNQDFGDAPKSYGTRASDGGAAHLYDSRLRIGSQVDLDLDGIPSPNAGADDKIGRVDDEDGLLKPLMLIPGVTTEVKVLVTNNLPNVTARLYGWIDVDQSGSFDSLGDSSELRWKDVPPGTTSVTLKFPPVSDEAVGTTFARFRLTTDLGIGPTGFASDGEVEDYPASIVRYDFGDAPDQSWANEAANYNTLEKHEGPFHLIDKNLRLGATIDVESDGQPTLSADGDIDDGLVNPALDLRLTPGVPPRVEILANNNTGRPASLYGWIDVNANGLFEDGEQASETVPSQPGAQLLVLKFDQVPIPPLSRIGETYARFRLSTSRSAASSPTGPAPDGEVEDYLVTIVNLDYGDAPDTGIGTGPGNYNTLDADDGPTHNIVKGLYLGSGVDNELDSDQFLPEPDGRQRLSANGDDQTGLIPDDEDGLVDPVGDLKQTVGNPALVEVSYTNTTGKDARLYGWIDYNMNGVFENATERAGAPVPSRGTGTVILDFGKVPAMIGTTYARFRLTTDDLEPLVPFLATGHASNGEVEDYVVTISEADDGSEPPIIETVLRGGYITERPGQASFGYSVASLGDLDGNGAIDYAVGDPLAPKGGKVELILLNPNGSIKKEIEIFGSEYGRTYRNNGKWNTITIRGFGDSMTSLDVDGDGSLELVVGAKDSHYSICGDFSFCDNEYYGGAAVVLYLNEAGTVETSYVHENAYSYSYFGDSVASIGDINHDGTDDLAVGAQGAVYVLPLNPDGSLNGTRRKLVSGVGNMPTVTNLAAIAGIGDVDGDNIPDLGIGTGSAVHAVTLDSLGNAKNNPFSIAWDTSEVKAQANAGFGRSLANVGDLDGDGVDDLAVGAPLDNLTGALHLLFMNEDGTVRETSKKIGRNTPDYIPLVPGQQFGTSVAYLGTDSSGYVRLVAGATASNGGSGRAYRLILETKISPNTLAAAIDSLPLEKTELETSASAKDFQQWVEKIAELPEQPRPNKTFTITLKVEPGVDYEGVEFDVPSGYTLVVDGNDGSIIFTGASPALTLISGDLLVTGGVKFTNDTDAPTILVQGGRLTLRDAIVEETTSADRPAIEITGGTIDLGTEESPGGNTINIIGEGDLIHNATSNPISAIGNNFHMDGVNLDSNFELEDAILHGLDRGDAGLVTYVADHVYLMIDEGTLELDLTHLIADLNLSDPAFAISAAVGGSASVLADQQTASFHAFDDGDASFSYNVWENDVLVGTRTVNFRVSNVAPVVDLGPGLTVKEGDPVSLADKFSDPGSGDTHTFLWQVASDNGQVITDSNDRDFSFTPTDNGQYTVTYTVTDDDGGVGSDSVVVLVENVSPQLRDLSVDLVENTAVRTTLVQLSAIDPGNDSITYSTIGGSGETAFTVDSLTGEISVLDPSLIDFESSPAMTLLVEVADDDGGVDTAEVTINLLNQPSISGIVYVDVNQDGIFQANEPGIDAVTIELRDVAGDAVLDANGDAITALTSDGGFYLFEDLDPADYQVFQRQPSGVADGGESLGSLGGSVVSDDTMQLTLERIDAHDYAFAEIGGQLTSGESAGIGFWQNKHGQSLIAEGGVALASWLTTSFGNVFGNTLSNAGGQQVAEFYRDQLFFQKGKKSSGPAKVDAQFMATALNVYFTNRNLAGDVGSSYGLAVSDTGLGVRVVNVGSRGAAFGVDDGTDWTVTQLLLATNSLTDADNMLAGFASIYDVDGDGILDASEAHLRTLANEVYAMINEQ